MHKRGEKRKACSCSEEEWELLIEKLAQKGCFVNKWNLKNLSGSSVMAAAADVEITKVLGFIKTKKQNKKTAIDPDLTFLSSLCCRETHH